MHDKVNLRKCLYYLLQIQQEVCMMSPAEERFRVSSDESDNMNTETYVKLNYFYLNEIIGKGELTEL